MALEAVVFPQDPFCNYGSKDYYNLLDWSYDFGLENEDDHYQLDFLGNQTENISPYRDWNSSSSPPPPPNSSILPPHLSTYPEAIATSDNGLDLGQPQSTQLDTSASIPQGRPRRRRSKSRKNKEEIENQRMTHIAVERNRRKQMNEYLSVLRSLMPDSYVQRGDQASVIGGAINFVKKLEQQVQYLSTQTDYSKEEEEEEDEDVSAEEACNLPFSDFFTFPQYSTTPQTVCDNSIEKKMADIAAHDIEVSMVERHATIKIRSKRRPKQLLKIVSGLQAMFLSVLHLNVTTVDPFVFYSLSVKVEEDCKLSSVNEIATTVYQLL